ARRAASLALEPPGGGGLRVAAARLRGSVRRLLRGRHARRGGGGARDRAAAGVVRIGARGAAPRARRRARRHERAGGRRLGARSDCGAWVRRGIRALAGSRTWARGARSAPPLEDQPRSPPRGRRGHDRARRVFPGRRRGADRRRRASRSGGARAPERWPDGPLGARVTLGAMNLAIIAQLEQLLRKAPELGAIELRRRW